MVLSALYFGEIDQATPGHWTQVRFGVNREQLAYHMVRGLTLLYAMANFYRPGAEVTEIKWLQRELEPQPVEAAIHSAFLFRGDSQWPLTSCGALSCVLTEQQQRYRAGLHPLRSSTSDKAQNRQQVIAGIIYRHKTH